MHPYLPIIEDPHTFCAVGSGPAGRAHTLPTGRVADAIVAAATGLVTSFPIETGWARCQERDKQYHNPVVNFADQKWKFQCLVSDTGKSMGNTESALSHVLLNWVSPNNRPAASFCLTANPVTKMSLVL